MTEDPRYTLAEANRKFAVLTNNRAWELLESEVHTPADTDELILAGMASLYHWLGEEKPVNIQRAYWLLAHIHTVLGQVDQAVKFAHITREWTERHPTEMKDFDLAYAWEALARSEALAGNHTTASEYHQKARAAGDLIADPEDREIFVRDFSSGNWYGLKTSG